MGIDEEFFVPGVAHAARIGGGVDARAPVGLEVRQQVEMSWYLRAVRVVASSMPITSYSRPR